MLSPGAEHDLFWADLLQVILHVAGWYARAAMKYMAAVVALLSNMRRECFTRISGRAAEMGVGAIEAEDSQLALEKERLLLLDFRRARWYARVGTEAAKRVARNPSSVETCRANNVLLRVSKRQSMSVSRHSCPQGDMCAASAR